MRNQLKASIRETGPRAAAKIAEIRNQIKYGDKLGPSADQLFKDKGSWEKVVEGLSKTNDGLNKFLDVKK